MFKAKRIATLLFVGTTLAAMPALGRATATTPYCKTPIPYFCYELHFGYLGNCIYNAGCSCYCGPYGCGAWQSSAYGYCQYVATPAK